MQYEIRISLNMLGNNLYSLLNVLRTANQDEIKKAYKKAVLKAHPDKGGLHEEFQSVQHAFDVLSDPLKRKQYDKELRLMNSKDGTTVVQETSDTEYKQASNSSKEIKKPRDLVVELPNNPSNLSISELKSLLTSLEIGYEGCFEKQDFIDKVNDYKKSKMSKSEPKSTESTTFIKKVLPNGLPAVKIISVGAQEVGKSCIIKRYCEGRFAKRYIPTIGVDYGVKVVDTKSGSVAIHFFDLSGNEDFKLIRQDFLTNAQGVIMAFDVNDRETLKLLSLWENEMKSNGVDPSKIPTVVMGNKIDVGRREVSENEGNKWSKAKGYPYYDCSANTGVNIAHGLDYLFNAVLKSTIEARKSFGIS